MTFADVLGTFKTLENEYIENMIQLAEDTILRNGFLAWQSMDVDYNANEECPVGVSEEKKQWSWMWSQVKIDYKKFSVVANVKEYDAPTLIERLRALRMIYPDGTCNSQARKFLREQVIAHRPGWQMKLRQQLKDQSKEKSDATNQASTQQPG